MQDVFAAGNPDDDHADLWAALGVEAAAGDDSGAPVVVAGEADDLETVVRRHGGRLPGSDPRR